MKKATKPAKPTSVKKRAAPAKKAAVSPKRGATAKRAAPAKRVAAATKMAPRADLGAPVDGFFARQPPHLRPILDELRALIGEVAAGTTSSIKWGMPFYLLDGEIVCALAAFKAHVNLILPGPPGTYADPDGLLEGDGKTGRHLKVRTLDELPRAVVVSWLRIAAERAKSHA